MFPLVLRRFWLQALLCSLTGGLPASVRAGTPPSSRESAQAGAVAIASDWRGLQTELAAPGISPEERIRRVDEWRAEKQPSIDALAAAQKQAAGNQSAGSESRPPVTLPPEALPEAARMMEIDRQLAAGVESLQKKKLTPEQRVQAVDEMLASNQTLIEERGQLQKAMLQQQAAVPSPASPPANPQEARAAQAAGEIRATIDAANQLSPEARIAAIDAAQPEIRQKEAELRRLQQAAQPVSPAPAPSKQP